MNDHQIAGMFDRTLPNIVANSRLREPQIEAYRAVQKHFAQSNEPTLLQIPVGCGKTGLMSILPFGICQKRVLIVAPNVTIRESIFNSVDSGSKACFWRQMGVAPLTIEGPFAAKIDGPDANLADCANSHFVVTNVQQLSHAKSRWLGQLPPDFFDMILIDEGHHNAAASWRRLMDHFAGAKVVSMTATPFRSDRKRVIGTPIYRYPFLRAMARGYIKSLRAYHVAPCELSFTFRDESTCCSLEDILKTTRRTVVSQRSRLGHPVQRTHRRRQHRAMRGAAQRNTREAPNNSGGLLRGPRRTDSPIVSKCWARGRTDS